MSVPGALACLRLVLQSLCYFFPPPGTHVGSVFHCLHSFSFLFCSCASVLPVSWSPHISEQRVRRGHFGALFAHLTARLFCLSSEHSVLPNEGYDEEYFSAYIERWSAQASNLALGLLVCMCVCVCACVCVCGIMWVCMCTCIRKQLIK